MRTNELSSPSSPTAEPRRREKEHTDLQLNTHAYNDYIAALFAPQDPVLTETIAEVQREGVRMMNVSPTEGRLLQVLALAVGAKRILEIGTLGGYSGIHLARILPEDGKLITLEIDPHHAEVARRNFERAEMGQKVDVRVGPAGETLRHLTAGESGTKRYNAAVAAHTDLTTIIIPILRQRGLDGLTVSFKH